jgi:hypothetical protein
MMAYCKTQFTDRGEVERKKLALRSYNIVRWIHLRW